jgi:N-acyl-D-amino-acid deacylase
MEYIDETVALGGELHLLTHCRASLGSAQSFLTTLSFDCLDEWQDVRRRPLAEQAVLLRDPDVRRRLVHAAHHGRYAPDVVRPRFGNMEIVQSPYLPNPTVEAEAARRRVDPVEAMIDIALERDLDVFFFTSFARQDHHDRLLQPLRHWDERQIESTMKHARSVMTFSDSGAHVSQIFDSSIYSHLLAYWVRERQAVSLEEAVHMMTSKPAAVWRLRDRGRLEPGYAADLTVFDAATVAPVLPTVVADLPGGARRIDQRAVGYAATVVNGQVLTRDGEPTDARPGRLLRAVRQ